MIPFNTLIKFCWIVFVVIWLILSLGAKKNIQDQNRRQNSLIRFATIFIAIVVLRLTGLHRLANHFFSPNHFVQGVGVFICAVGIAFAIWARIQIGENWGMPMSLKEKPELVTSGPYRFVRHPIYTGLCVAMIGSMITEGFLWFIWFIVLSPYFIYSANKEEKIMLLQFPDQYPDYMKRTKMLIPFIF